MLRVCLCILCKLRLVHRPAIEPAAVRLALRRAAMPPCCHPKSVIAQPFVDLLAAA